MSRMIAGLKRFRWLAVLVALLWAIQSLNHLTGGAINRSLALDPRDLSGLPGILAAPFLHSSFAHLAANTGPLVVMGIMMTLTAPRRLWPATAIAVIGGGLAVWLLARDGLHVGASGLIFGWFGFLLARGIVDHSPRTSLAALAVALLYGAMIWGVLPSAPNVSWEGHLFGILAGGGAAWVLRDRKGTEK